MSKTTNPLRLTFEALPFKLSDCFNHCLVVRRVFGYNTTDLPDKKVIISKINEEKIKYYLPDSAPQIFPQLRRLL
jgi:hypothetical protein